MYNSLYVMVDVVEQIRRPALALCLAGGVLVATDASAETKMVKAVPSIAAQYSFTVLPNYPFAFPSANYNNTPRAINNSNVIAGSENGQSYVLVQPDYYAPATDTENNAVGTATVLGLSNGAAPMLAGSVFGFENGGGFVRTNDTYFLVAYPNTGPSGGYLPTTLYSVNARGIAVGAFTDIAKLNHALLYDNTSGKMRRIAISYHGLSQSTALGINDHDVIVGSVVVTGTGHPSYTYGFFGTGDSFTIVTFADTIYSTIQFSAINNKGIAVGSVYSNNITHGLIYDTNANTAQILDAPLISSGTTITGINDSGAIVGFYPVANGKDGSNVGFVAYPN